MFKTSSNYYAVHERLDTLQGELVLHCEPTKLDPHQRLVRIEHLNQALEALICQ